MRVQERDCERRFGYFKGDSLDGRLNLGYKANKRHCFCLFESRPLIAKANGAGAATGTAGDVNVMLVNGYAPLFEYAIKGTQTIVAPVIGADGLDFGMDQTDNDGVEFTNGITALAPSAFVAGTDQDFFVRAKIKVEDISGTDDLCVGWRKAEAYQANVDDYDEAAFLQVGGGAAGRINTETILNNGATTTTNTGLTAWADGATHTLEVRVGANRKVTYYYDGAKINGTAAFTFDSGEVLVPFLFFLHSADVAGAVQLIEWEWGLVDVKDN